ncbi:hypothetical protein [Nocardiopsis lucentensis]|uniref:hypothetical protein n=1 Tax=Nocardiopsis lucentensis TaxID=53441 RepID=UPI00034D928C|nr:hypothetical protein [Nocardiopsis lucentensis]
MTSHMLHHLNSDDDSGFERAMTQLDTDGLEVRPAERAALARAHGFGDLTPLLALIHRAMDTGTTVEQIRYRRRVEEMRRPASHRATYRAEENHPPAERWRVSEDGTSFYHPACGKTYSGGIDSVDTHERAADHHNRTCEEVRRG